MFVSCVNYILNSKVRDMDPLLVNEESGKYSKQDKNEVIIHVLV